MCEDCKTAAQQVHHGFTFGCQGCSARAAARSQPYRDAQQAGRLTSNYRWLLQQFGLTAGEVSRAAAADKLHEEARA